MKNKKIILLVIVAIIVLGLGAFYLFNNKGKNTPKPDTPTIKNEYSFIYANDDNQIIGVKMDGTKVTLVEKANTMYDGYDIDNETLYFVDKDYFIHTIKLDNDLKDNKTNTKINNKFWDIKASNNKVFVFGLSGDWFTELYDLNNSEVLKLPFTSNYRGFFQDGVLYYTDCDDKIVKKYNLKTNESIKITSGDSRPLAINKDFLLYIVDDTVCLYDIQNNTSKIIVTGVDQQANFSPDIIVFNNNDVFYINKDKLYKYSNNKVQEVMDLKNKDYDHNEYKIVDLTDNKILLLRANYKEADCYYGCEVGIVESLIFDSKTNALTPCNVNFEELYYTSNAIIYVR